MLDYLNKMTYGQKIYWGLLAATTISGGAYAYKMGAGELVSMIRDNKEIVAAATALGSMSLWLPMAVKVSANLPAFMTLPAWDAQALAGVHLGAIAMRNNPLHLGAIAMRHNPLHLGAISHSMNGLAY